MIDWGMWWSGFLLGIGSLLGVELIGIGVVLWMIRDPRPPLD